MTDSRILAAAAAMLTALFADCPEPSGAQIAAAGTGVGVEDRLIELEERLLTADYRADLAALAALRDEATGFAADPEWGFLARYWAGFASWRSALNGANIGRKPEELAADLERAAAELEAAIALRPDFADGLSAAASVHGWLTRFSPDDPGKTMRHLVLYFTRLRRARELAPDNPRVLWVDASVDLFTPVALGGDPESAIRIYRRMLSVSRRTASATPWPDWGEPEARMSLAFAYLNLTPPRLEAAREEALAALRLRPDWSYVRDTLLPQIEAKSGAPAPGGS